jgi:hypothetical protein
VRVLGRVRDLARAPLLDPDLRILAGACPELGKLRVWAWSCDLLVLESLSARALETFQIALIGEARDAHRLAEAHRRELLRLAHLVDGGYVELQVARNLGDGEISTVEIAHGGAQLSELTTLRHVIR